MQAYTNTNGADIISASKRSNQPPCPGIILPESFMSIERLNIDSIKSPNTPDNAATNASPIQTKALASTTSEAT